MKKVFITGGAGFIGSNVAKYYLDKGFFVTLYDNLSRPGVEKNLKWLTSIGSKRNLRCIKGDVRDYKKLLKSISKEALVFHEAAQVAVTSSLEDPFKDFEINARGTLNVLEAVRKRAPGAVFVYSSTNKVYGSLEQTACVKRSTRYIFNDRRLKKGVDENVSLDFHSPYGCSKGAGDQYVRDYSRVFGLKTLVFRQSCIYGTRQFGNEDQGWVMHFVKKVLTGNKVKIYGDGCQVRDILDVRDLIDAYNRAILRINKTSGKVYNIGGGAQNAISVIELVNLLQKKLDKKVKIQFSNWREGDQKVFISNNAKISKDISWTPKISLNTGIDDLIVWAKSVI